MKKLLLFSLLLAALSLNGQTEMWTKEVSKGAFMSQLEDGKIFLKDKTKISLVNNETGEVEWESKVSTKLDPRFLENLPIMYFDGKSYAVIDGATGHVIDESKTKTEILDISYYWDEARVVIEMDRSKNLHVLNIDLNNPENSWNTKVGPVQKEFFGLSSRASTNAPSISKDGSLVLVDKKYISILAKDGTVKERIDFNKKIKKVGYNTANDILYVVEDEKKLHYVDVATGETVATVELDEKDLRLNVLDAGNTISIVQKKEILILDGGSGEEKGRSELKSKIKDVYKDEETGRLYVLSKKMVSEIDVKTGKVAQESTYDKDFNDIYSVHDKVILGGHSGISPIDLSTLKLAYKKIARIPAVQDYVDMGKYTGYTFQVQDQFTLSVVDRTGKVVWDKNATSMSPPTLDVLDNGLLMVGGSRVEFLSIKDGSSLWKEKVEVRPYFAYGVDKKTEDMYMYADKRIFKFDPSKGSITKSEEKFKFKDFDYEAQKPQFLVLDDVIFMKGSNTVFVISKDGELIHEKTYKRVSTGATLMKLANVAVTAAAIGTGNGGEVLTVYSGDKMVHKGGMVDGLNDNWSYAEGMKNARRAKQNRSSNAYPYVFTKLENGKRAVIFLNASDGDEKFSVTLDEKDPDYIVDDIDGVLFHLSKTTLKAYDVK